MAKGGNSQRSNGSRFTKPYNVSNVSICEDATRFARNAENRSWPMVKHNNDLPCVELYRWFSKDFVA